MKLFTFDLEREGISKYHIVIGGFRGCSVGNNVERLFDRVRELADGKKILALQLFNADRIATHLHLLVSTIYALQAFKNSKNISNTIGNETLLYASAQRQITDAIAKVGVEPRSPNLAAAVITSLPDSGINLINRLRKELGGVTDDSVLDINERRKIETIRGIFKIGDAELEATEFGTEVLDIESALTKRILSRISIMAISK